MCPAISGQTMGKLYQDMSIHVDSEGYPETLCKKLLLLKLRDKPHTAQDVAITDLPVSVVGGL